MRRLALMESITMTKTTQITRVRFAFPQIADRSLTVGVGGAFWGTGLSSFGPGELAGAERGQTRPPERAANADSEAAVGDLREREADAGDLRRLRHRDVLHQGQPPHLFSRVRARSPGPAGLDVGSG